MNRLTTALLCGFFGLNSAANAQSSDLQKFLQGEKKPVKTERTDRAEQAAAAPKKAGNQLKFNVHTVKDQNKAGMATILVPDGYNVLSEFNWKASDKFNFWSMTIGLEDKSTKRSLLMFSPRTYQHHLSQYLNSGDPAPEDALSYLRNYARTNLKAKFKEVDSKQGSLVQLKSPFEGQRHYAQQAWLLVEYSEDGVTMQHKFWVEYKPVVISTDLMTGTMWKVKVDMYRTTKEDMKDFDPIATASINSLRGTPLFFSMRDIVTEKLLADDAKFHGEFMRVQAQIARQDARRWQEEITSIQRNGDMWRDLISGNGRYTTSTGAEVVAPVEYPNVYETSDGSFVATDDNGSVPSSWRKLNRAK
jgi:hypothetical protein